MFFGSSVAALDRSSASIGALANSRSLDPIVDAAAS